MPRKKKKRTAEAMAADFMNRAASEGFTFHETREVAVVLLEMLQAYVDRADGYDGDLIAYSGDLVHRSIQEVINVLLSEPGPMLAPMQCQCENCRRMN